MSFVKSFGERKNKDFKNANDIMNWIIFWDDNKFYGDTTNDKTL